MVLKWVDQDLQKRRRMEREPGGPVGFGALSYSIVLA